MRFDAKTRTLSVYDVYHEVKPDVPTDNIGHNLRRSKLPDKTAKFGAFITPDRCVSLPQVHGSAPRRNGKPTPALRSRDELDRFLVLLSGGLKGPDVSLFSQRVDNFQSSTTFTASLLMNCGLGSAAFRRLNLHLFFVPKTTAGVLQHHPTSSHHRLLYKRSRKV